MKRRSLDFLYKQASLSSDETVQGRWCAGRIMGGVPAQGGQIILTNSRVIFNPINTDFPFIVGKVLSHNNIVSKVLGKVRDITERIVSIPLDQIERVEPIGQPSLLSPPKVVITLRDGSRYQFGFGVSIWSPNFRPKNAQVRDDFVQRLQAMRRVW